MNSEIDMSAYKELLSYAMKLENLFCYAEPSSENAKESLRLIPIVREKQLALFPNSTEADFNTLVSDARYIFANITHTSVMMTYTGSREMWAILLNVKE